MPAAPADRPLPGAVCLDLSRLLSRVGRGPLTGIDRVERAYADFVLGAIADPTFLFRTSRGYVLTGPAVARRFLDGIDGRRAWARPDAISILTGKGAVPRHGAEAELRAGRIARCLPRGVGRMLARHLPRGVRYLNTGHSNLTGRMLSGIRGVAGARVTVFIHDLIPVLTPEFARPEVPARFAAMLARVGRGSDLVICNSADTETRLRAHLAGQDRMPDFVTAHLGLSPIPKSEPVSGVSSLSKARFVSLGTIEPRKNIGLLLDVWEELARQFAPEDLPQLHLVGRRGWRSEALLARLDAHPLRNRVVFEHSGLSDGQVRTLLQGSLGLLFPTLSEGFGLPPAEAARLGVVPFCADLTVLREVMGKSAVYLDPRDVYSWTETIKKRIAGKADVPDMAQYRAPTWQAHFQTVAAAL